MARSAPSRVRLFAFGLVTAASVLVLGNAAVEWLERRGAITTERRDDVVQFVNEALFTSDGTTWRTTAYAHDTMVPAAFPVAQQEWRAFLLGGSFMMGTPYVHQGHGEERPGGIGSWLREWIEPAEIIVAASGAASSQRVVEVASQVIQLDPDVLVVATCNNEGEYPPSRVRAFLHKQGGYRLLSRLLVTPPSDEQRPVYARQSTDVLAIRSEWAANVEEIVADAGRRGVPVVLCTLPVHLRYDHQDGKAFERGFLDDTRWEEGAPVAADPCVAAGIARYDAGAFAEAIEALASCTPGAEVLRFSGLAYAALGESARALPLLEQSVELVPRNRCRPSFNDDLRAIAAANAHVHLADLDAVARAASPGGLPGRELFTDYCHMTWRGYGLMAQEITRTLEAAGLLPAPAKLDAVERASFAEELIALDRPDPEQDSSREQ